MPHFKLSDWTDAYANAPHVVGGDGWGQRFEAASLAFRAGVAATPSRAVLARGYGADARQRLDLFVPDGPPAGLVVFIHGGYWLRFQGEDWSHLAAGPLAHGYAVAIPTYRLCPTVRIAEITRDVAVAIEAVAALIEGPIVLTGHSAGGHLATRMITSTSPLSHGVLARVRHTLSISGVHDLRPLMRTEMNARLGLDADEAAVESPALLTPIEGARVTCWVGGAERSEFRRQSALLANVWTGLGAATLAIEEPDRHHFDVVEGLADATSSLVEMVLS